MKKIICAIVTVVMSVFMIIIPLTVHSPAFADQEGENCYKGAILSTCDPNSDGSGISEVLKIAIRVFTVAIGVLAAIGITITGVQYLTAGGNEEQTRKAKRRLFEIVIGLAAFVLIYAVLSWLLPGFSPAEIWG